MGQLQPTTAHMGLAAVTSGWMMLLVLVANALCLNAHTEDSGHMTAPMQKILVSFALVIFVISNLKNGSC